MLEGRAKTSAFETVSPLQQNNFNTLSRVNACTAEIFIISVIL